ncbi:MFS transporter [Streptomyces sp. TRM43335]|uniref:MFS transporter n=1 Tax=Streptomyces taklimakanensis TaxID=2569853 RepID=A0A6G2BHJ2_9ACTN|nr:MFS transporter [Streptomyces taklimakanensis]MTE21539.1 MFS transporter [Streptomyces taklimakanensis]
MNAVNAVSAVSAVGTDRRPLALLLTAHAVSVAGNALTLVAVPWFVLQTTGSAARAGLVAFCATVPVVVAAVVGGPVIDRLGRLRTSVVSDTVCAVAVGAVPLLHHTGTLRFWHLCALMAVSGLFHAPGETARGVLLPDLARCAGTTVTRAASLHDGVSRGARMVGAAAGGTLAALLGAGTVLLVDAVTFAGSALLVAGGLRGLSAAAPRRPDPSATPRSRRTYLAELREGYAYVLRTRLILAVVLMVMVTNGLGQAWLSVLLPVHAESALDGARSVGLLVSLSGGGALVGALVYGAFGHRLPRRPVFAVCFLLTGSPQYVTAALTDGLAALAVVTVLSGVAAGALNPILSTVLFETIPESLRSRAMSVTTAGVLMAMPLGGLAAGLAVEGVGLVPTLLTVGCLYFVTTLGPLVFPVWRAMDRPAGVDDPDGTGGGGGGGGVSAPRAAGAAPTRIPRSPRAASPPGPGR